MATFRERPQQGEAPTYEIREDGSLSAARLSINIPAASALSTRMDALSELLTAVNDEITCLEVKLRSVLVSSEDNPGKAVPPESFDDAASELAGFFIYAAARLRDLRERVAYIAERVDL